MAGFPLQESLFDPGRWEDVQPVVLAGTKTGAPALNHLRMQLRD